MHKILKDINLVQIDDLTVEKPRPRPVGHEVTLAFSTFVHNGNVVGVVKFASENEPPVSPDHPDVRYLTAMADSSSIPIFLVQNAKDFSWYDVVAGNSTASKLVPASARLTEPGWVDLIERCVEMKSE